MTPRRHFISVIIPVRNEAGTLPALLRQLLEQEDVAGIFEIIVADGGSTDGTLATVKAVARTTDVPIHAINNEGIRSSSGRNAGLMVARGGVIVFLDGHCHIPSRRLLADTLTLLEETQAECLCRPQPLTAPTSSATARAIAAARASKLGHGSDSLIYDITRSGFVDPASSGATYRADAIQKIGPYDTRFDACEDVDLNIRLRKAGMRAFTDPRLAVHYEARNTLSGLLKQMVRYGRGRVRLAAKHRDTLSLATLLPLILLACAVATVVSLTFPGLVRTTLLACAGVYLFGLLASSIYLGYKFQPRCYWQGVPIYLTIHLGLGLGLLIELLHFPRFEHFAHAEAAPPTHQT